MKMYQFSTETSSVTESRYMYGGEQCYFGAAFTKTACIALGIVFPNKSNTHRGADILTLESSSYQTSDFSVAGPLCFPFGTISGAIHQAVPVRCSPLLACRDRRHTTRLLLCCKLAWKYVLSIVTVHNRCSNQAMYLGVTVNIFKCEEYMHALLVYSNTWLNLFFNIHLHTCNQVELTKLNPSFTQKHVNMHVHWCLHRDETYWALKKLDTSKVSQLDVSIFIQENIAALDITVDDLSAMKILQPLKHLSGVPPGPHLIQFTLSLQYISKWSLYRYSHWTITPGIP